MRERREHVVVDRAAAELDSSSRASGWQIGKRGPSSRASATGSSAIAASQKYGSAASPRCSPRRTARRCRRPRRSGEAPRAARAESGRTFRTRPETATSNVASSTGRSRASPTVNRWTPPASARCRAPSMKPSERSIPCTMRGANLVAAIARESAPVPHPTSSQRRSSGRESHSTNARATGSLQRPM